MPKRQDAPGRLELVRGFVNSLDLEEGTDAFTTRTGLRDWLHTAGLITTRDRVTDPDRTRAVELREAIRTFATVNTDGATPDPAAVAVLNHTTQDAAVTLTFDTEGAPTLTGTAGGAAAALGTLAAIIAVACVEGTWQRMRVCPNPDCQWMFYDHSKNRSGRWCQMAECGNRAKVAAYRDRTT